MLNKSAKTTEIFQIQSATKLIYKLINDHPEIENYLWSSTFVTLIIHGMLKSGFTPADVNPEFTLFQKNFNEHYAAENAKKSDC